MIECDARRRAGNARATRSRPDMNAALTRGESAGRRAGRSRKGHSSERLGVELSEGVEVGASWERCRSQPALKKIKKFGPWRVSTLGRDALTCPSRG